MLPETGLHDLYLAFWSSSESEELFSSPSLSLESFVLSSSSSFPVKPRAFSNASAAVVSLFETFGVAARFFTLATPSSSGSASSSSSSSPSSTVSWSGSFSMPSSLSSSASSSSDDFFLTSLLPPFLPFFFPPGDAFASAALTAFAHLSAVLSLKSSSLSRLILKNGSRKSR